MTLVSIKGATLLIELSTCVSAAKLKIVFGLYCLKSSSNLLSYARSTPFTGYVRG